MIIRKPTKHIKKLCEELGDQYSIKVIDCEQVIYRDFHNGYDVEISGLNHNSSKAKATIYLWKDKAQTVRTIEKVDQGQIGQVVEELYKWSNDRGVRMAYRKWWKNTCEYKRILEILDDYWLTEKNERFVRVEMYFEKADGQTQEKQIVWQNPNMRESVLGYGRHVSEEELLPEMSAKQLCDMGDLPFKEYVILKYGRDPEYVYDKDECYDEDPFGDFAHDLARDDHFPIYDYGTIYGSKWHHDQLLSYVAPEWRRNEKLREVFEQCYREWENRYLDSETFKKLERLRDDEKEITKQCQM